LPFVQPDARVDESSGDTIKITGVEAFVLQVPLKRPAADSMILNPFWGVPGCRIYTDAGIVGTGYTGTYSWGDEAFKPVIETHFAEVLVGQSPWHVRYLWDLLHWSNLHWVGRAGIVSMAHAAVDIALWDINAKAAGLPLWKMLGGHKPAGVPVYNTNAGWLNWSVDELLEDMSGLLDDGWTALKMKVGGPDVNEDIRRVREVRKALGDGFTLMVDANQIWNLPTAEFFARSVEDLGIYWLEEPCHPDDIRAHSRLAARTAIPLAVGENIYSKYAFRDYIEADAVTFVQADCTRLSGVTEWLQVADLAGAYNLPVAPHHGDFAQVQQHLVAAVPNAERMEYIPWMVEANVFEHPIELRDGRLLLPDFPGASTDIRADAYERFQIA
jgi:L-alanine-DL-glutamate epimerase-like enolase superfamily enzyme